MAPNSFAHSSFTITPLIVLLHTSLFVALMLCMEVFEWTVREGKVRGGGGL